MIITNIQQDIHSFCESWIPQRIEGKEELPRLLNEFETSHTSRNLQTHRDYLRLLVGAGDFGVTRNEIYAQLFSGKARQKAVEQLESIRNRINSILLSLPSNFLSNYLRDSNTTNSKGTRLLIVQTQSANRTLSIEDTEQYSYILAQSDLLLLDGYCFLDQLRRDAVLRAMQIARANNVVIAFDVVPHHAYKLYNLDTLKSMVELSNLLITELVTIRRFLGFDVPNQILDKNIALETVTILQSEFKNKAFFLRFGIGNCDQSLVCLPGKPPRHSFTGYGSSQSEELRGFGDRLSARELAETLPILKANITGEI